jgi:DNA-binding winged helix-turn-helix (wHTH) protein/tetratricopeptide (TPR) repeat protein
LHPKLQFGVFEVDLDSGELRRTGIKVKLQEQPFKVLAALLERPGEVVSRDELRQRIWPDATFGDGDHAVNVAVTKLRVALRDSAEAPHVIETLHRRGYRLLVAVRRSEFDPSLEGGAKPTAVNATTTPAASALETPPPGLARSSAFGPRVARWVAFTIAMAVAVGSAIWLNKAHSAMPPNTTVLIGAFENNTGEPVLDGTLQFALERELSNSQSVHVVSPERVQDILQLMRRPADTPVDRALALEICRRTPDIRLLLTGRAQKIGSRYLFTASMVDPASGNMVHAAEAEGGKQDEILDAIHTLATKVRRDLGENIPLTPRTGEPLEQVTTRSLRALQLYSEALDQMILHGTEVGNGLELLREAVNEDPDFASAHVMFAQALRDLGDPEATPHFERAFAMAHSASERERLFITGSYYASKDNGNEAFTKAVTAYEELLRHYPDDLWALNNLSVLYEMWGRTEKSLQLGMRIADLRPEMVPVRVYGLAVHSDDATLDRIAAGCDHPSNLHSCQLVFMVRDARPIWQLLRKGDADEAFRIAQTLGDHASQAYPKATEVLSLILSDFYLDTGMLEADAKLTSETLRGNDNAYAWFTDPILIAHHRRDRAAEREALTPYLKYPPDAALYAPAYVESGRLEDLRGVLRKLEKRDGQAGVYWVSGIVELAEGDVARSIDNLRRAKDANEPGGYPAADQLATALERAGRIDEAVDTLRKCQTKLASQPDSDAVWWNNLDGRWHLARLYRQVGHLVQAEAEESALRAQLKLADPDHAIARALKQLPLTTQSAARD